MTRAIAGHARPAYRLALTLGAAIALALPGPAWSARRVDVAHWHQGHWHLQSDHERFRGNTTCRLSNRRLRFVAGALRVTVPGARPMDNAAYRVDGGPARLVRDDLPELMQHQVPVDRGNMNRPSGHLVWIAFSRIATAQRLEIQPRPGAHARTIDIAGLAMLRNIAAQHGCADDRAFVE